MLIRLLSHRKQFIAFCLTRAPHETDAQLYRAAASFALVRIYGIVIHGKQQPIHAGFSCLVQGAYSEQ